MLTLPTLALVASMVQAAATQAAPPPAAGQVPTPEAKPAPDGPVIAIDTTMGTIEVGLYATKAPISTRNIMSYVKSGFYAGTTFHRVMPGFMIQGGGVDAKMVEKETGPPIRNEARNGLLNSRGSLSMARTSEPQSATSQFFINVKDNPGLDFGISRDGWGYAVFGEVLKGMEVVDQIVNVPTSTRGQHQNVPISPVFITKVRVLSEPASVTPPAATKANIPVPPKPVIQPRATPKGSPVASPAAKPKPTP